MYPAQLQQSQGQSLSMLRQCVRAFVLWLRSLWFAFSSAWLRAFDATMNTPSFEGWYLPPTRTLQFPIVMFGI